MNWVRMATSMRGDPKIHLIADACCKGDAAKVVGHLQFLFSAMATHAKGGDLSALPASVIEQWSGWTGKSGAWDRAIRAQLCDDRGVVRAWEKHNGAAIARADRERNRVNEWRGKKRSEGDPTPDGTPPVTRNTQRSERTALRGDGTGRDVTTTAVQCDSTAVLQPSRDGTAGILPIGTLAARAMTRLAGGAA